MNFVHCQMPEMCDLDCSEGIIQEHVKMETRAEAPRWCAVPIPPDTSRLFPFRGPRLPMARGRQIQ